MSTSRCATLERGLPAQIDGALFTPFVTTKAHGLGIGLTITQTIVDAHRGTIDARNNPEGGATFTVTLRRSGTPEIRSGPGARDVVTLPKRPRVLIAEDHPGVAKAVYRLLTLDCDVVGSIADGRPVLEAAQRLQPDVIVVDLNLPNVNGDRRGHGISWSERSRSCSKSLDREFSAGNGPLSRSGTRGRAGRNIAI